MNIYKVYHRGRHIGEKFLLPDAEKIVYDKMVDASKDVQIITDKITKVVKEKEVLTIRKHALDEILIMYLDSDANEVFRIEKEKF